MARGFFPNVVTVGFPRRPFREVDPENGFESQEAARIRPGVARHVQWTDLQPLAARCGHVAPEQARLFFGRESQPPRGVFDFRFETAPSVAKRSEYKLVPYGRASRAGPQTPILEQPADFPVVERGVTDPSARECPGACAHHSRHRFGVKRHGKVEASGKRPSSPSCRSPSGCCSPSPASGASSRSGRARRGQRTRRYCSRAQRARTQALKHRPRALPQIGRSAHENGGRKAAAPFGQHPQFEAPEKRPLVLRQPFWLKSKKRRRRNSTAERRRGVGQSGSPEAKWPPRAYGFGIPGCDEWAAVYGCPLAARNALSGPPWQARASLDRASGPPQSSLKSPDAAPISAGHLKKKPPRFKYSTNLWRLELAAALPYALRYEGRKRGDATLAPTPQRSERLAQADAEALIRDHGGRAYIEARWRQRDAVLPDGTACAGRTRAHWPRVAQIVARMTGKRGGLDTGTRMHERRERSPYH